MEEEKGVDENAPLLGGQGKKDACVRVFFFPALTLYIYCLSHTQTRILLAIAASQSTSDFSLLLCLSPSLTLFLMQFDEHTISKCGVMRTVSNAKDLAELYS